MLDAYAAVPAYHQLWNRSGVDPAVLDLPKDFQQLPVVSKNDFLEFEFKDRCLQDPNGANSIVERTSGSTGQPFATLISRKGRIRRQIRFLRALFQCGYRPGMRLMMLSTRDDLRTARLLNWLYVPITLGESELAAVYRKFKPSVVYGPLNTLMTVARGLNAEQEAIPQPRAVISTAEQLTQLADQQLRNTFGVSPADFYGLTETGLLAWKPAGENHFRIATDDFLLEFLPVPPDHSRERLVVTDLRKTAMPLVRFNTGDIVMRDDKVPGKPITGFVGREVDSLVLPNGESISPYRVTLALEAVECIRQYRVVQNADLSVHVEVWTIPDRTTETLDKVRNCLLTLAGGILPVTVMEGRDTSGPPERKFRPVQSAVWSNK